MSLLIYGAILSQVAGLCLAHLCIISPRQRGDFDISRGGSHTCFRHGAPCGGQAPASPKVKYTGGVTSFVKWQQNFNHYTVGFPGYMDIAVGEITDGGDPTNFTVFAVVPDENFHAQDHQKNYTAAVVFPNMDCKHCVVRMRYQSHKPGESIFYQCSDITIMKSTQPSSNIQNVNVIDESPAQFVKAAAELINDADAVNMPTFYGLAYDQFDPIRCHYVKAQWPDLYIHPLSTLPLGVTTASDAGIQSNVKRMNQNPSHRLPQRLKRHQAKSMLDVIVRKEEDQRGFLMDQLIAPDVAWGPGGATNVTIFMLEYGEPTDKPQVNYYVVGAYNGSLCRLGPIVGADPQPVKHIQVESPEMYLMLQVEQVQDKPGSFKFLLGRFNIDSEYFGQIAVSEPEDTYINFQWADYDYSKHLYYTLMGNENSPDQLQARVYTFSTKMTLGPRVTYKDLDVSKYTILAIQVYQKTGQLLAMSPGLFNTTQPAWALVEVNPVTGSIEKLYDVTPPGIFDRYYGGTIFNGIDNTKGLFYYKLRVAESAADMIVCINIETGKVTYSHMANLRHLHNLAIIDPGVQP